MISTRCRRRAKCGTLSTPALQRFTSCRTGWATRTRRGLANWANARRRSTWLGRNWGCRCATSISATNCELRGISSPCVCASAVIKRQSPPAPQARGLNTSSLWSRATTNNRPRRPAWRHSTVERDDAPVPYLRRRRVVDFDVRDGRAGFGRLRGEFHVDGVGARKAPDALVSHGCLPRDGLPASSAPDLQRKFLHALTERDILLRQESVELDLAPEVEFERRSGHAVICPPVCGRVPVNRLFGVEARVASADVGRFGFSFRQIVVERLFAGAFEFHQPTLVVFVDQDSTVNADVEQ